jgi:ankyrin repeat protein
LLSTGCTPLLRATLDNDLVVMRALIAKGASPNITGMGVTPFLMAAGVGTGARQAPNRDANMEAVELMLKNGANINAQVTGTQNYNMRIARSAATNEGMTALHVAAQSGDVKLVRYLLANGIDSKLRTLDGKLAIDLLPAASAPMKLVSATEAGVGGPVAKREASAQEIEEIRTLLAAR